MNVVFPEPNGALRFNDVNVLRFRLKQSVYEEVDLYAPEYASLMDGVGASDKHVLGWATEMVAAKAARFLRGVRIIRLDDREFFDIGAHWALGIEFDSYDINVRFQNGGERKFEVKYFGTAYGCVFSKGEMKKILRQEVSVCLVFRNGNDFHCVFHKPYGPLLV
jgi:hypothetical protein